MRTWEARGPQRLSTSEEATGRRVMGVMESSPRTAAMVSMPVYKKLHWGHGAGATGSGDAAAGYRVHRVTQRADFSATASVTQGCPGPLSPLHVPVHFREQLRARTFPGKMVPRRPRGPGPLCFSGKQLSENLAEPEVGSTLRLWGWESGGGE